MTMTPTPPGRPRSAAIDSRLTSATLALLQERGWEGFSFEGLAKRAGVSRSTVYARYSSRSEAVVAALNTVVPPLSVPSDAPPADELVELVAGLLVPLSNAPWGRVVLSVHAAGPSSPELSRSFAVEYWGPRRETFRNALERARNAGVIPTSWDERTARNLLFGPLVYSWLIEGAPITRDDVASHIGVLLGLGDERV